MMKILTFEEHLQAILKYWPEKIDVTTLQLPDDVCDDDLKRSIGLAWFYEETVAIHTAPLTSSIQVQLDWLVHCLVDAAMKEGQMLLRPHEVDRDELKRCLHELLQERALPQMNGTKEPDGSFYDFEEVKNYLLSYGLITPDLKPIE